MSMAAIDAKRDSKWYVIRKSLQRNRGAAAVAVAFVALLLIGSFVTGGLYLRSERQRLMAERMLRDGGDTLDAARKPSGKRSSRSTTGRHLPSVASWRSARSNTASPDSASPISRSSTWADTVAVPCGSVFPRSSFVL